jgi:adenylate kinase
MAPTGDDIHELIAKLEARVKELEARVLEGESGAPSAAKDGQSVRMVLMGPPGAGKSSLCLSRLCVFCLCLPLFVDLPNLGAISTHVDG